MTGRRLEFFFDFSSPFGYLASVAVPEVAVRHGAEVVYKPILLGGLFRAIGTPQVPLDAMSEAKRRYTLVDLQRWADLRGAPFAWPSAFPLRTVKPLRMTLLAAPAERQGLIAEVMAACWARGLDPDDDQVLRDCARAAGADEGLVGATRSDEAKAALRAVTDEAVDRGVPGVPTFFVDDQLFWGQDRLDFVERALDGHRPVKG